jgi:FkbM family methyltransferase
LTGRILHLPDSYFPKETVGTYYGSHTVRHDFLDKNSVVYSFGVGEDVSFDLGLIERYGCTVYAFDPTPRSVAWVETHVANSRFRFMPIGLAARDGETIFMPHVRPTHVSFSKPSSVSADRASGVFLQVKTLASIMRDLGHDSIDCVKMDIEGFEYEVVDWLEHTDIRPKLLLIEFHHRMYNYPISATIRAVEHLRSMGYTLFHVSDTGREYSFWMR